MKGYETMKATKKLLALVLAVVMIMAMAATAFADEPNLDEPTTTKTTVTIENAQKGTKYTFYKLFSYTGKEWYRVTSEWDEVLRYKKEGGTEKGYFDLDTIGYILSKTTKENEASLAKLLKEQIAGKTITKEVTAETDTVTVELELGYYLMVSELGGTESKASLAVIDKNGLKIREKNTPDGLPYLKKTYANGETDGEYNIGDTANFKIVITVQEGFKTDIVHDIATDLIINYSSVKVVVTPKNGAAYELVSPAFSVTQNPGDGCTFDISLTVAEPLKAYDTITITYSAIVDGDNPTNKAWLDKKDPGTDDPGTNSYNYGFKVQKTDNKNNPLDGAVFTLSRLKEIDGAEVRQYAQFDKDGKLTGWTTEEDKATPLTAGTISVSGLAAGTYYLRETVAPIGYKKLSEDISISISAIINKDTGKPTGKAKIEVLKDELAKVDGSTVNVKNSPIDPLPETGGMGTTMFYMLGGLMAAAALVLLTSKKRMAA